MSFLLIFFVWQCSATIEVYPEPYQTSKMELLAKIVNGFQPLTIFAKSSILDVRQGSKYTSNIRLHRNSNDYSAVSAT